MGVIRYKSGTSVSPGMPTVGLGAGETVVSRDGSVTHSGMLDDNGQTDWSKRIQQGISAGESASQIQGYLDQRNAKIAAAGGSLDTYKDDAVSAAARAYIQGHTPSSYTGSATRSGGMLDDNGQVDWSKRITSGINAGESADQIQSYLDQRNAKIAAAGGTLDAYQDDAVSAAARAYIQGLQATAGSQGTVSGPDYPVTFDSYQDLYDRGGYRRAEEKQRELLQAQLAQLTNAYDSQRGGINTSAEEQARQAYINHMQSLNTLPQALAASGYSGGLADSQRLDLELGYQNNQRQILQDRDQALNDVTTAMNNAKLQTSIEGLQAQEELMRQAATAYQNWVSQQNAYANQDYWNRVNYETQARQQAQELQDQMTLLEAQQRYNAQTQLQEQERERQLQSAQALAQNGDYSALGAYYGWTPEQIAAMNQRYAGQLAASQQSTLWDQAVEAATKLGDTSLYEALGGDPSYIQAIKAAELQTEKKKGTAKAGGTGGATPPMASDPYSYLAALGVTDEGAAYGYLLGKGYTSTEAKTIAQYYVDGLKEQATPWVSTSAGPKASPQNMAAIKQALAQAAQTGGDVQRLMDSVWDSGQYSDDQKQELLNYARAMGGSVG